MTYIILMHSNIRQDPMLKELQTPQNSNVLVGKMEGILEKAIDKPLGCAKV